MAGAVPREVLSEHFETRLAGKRLLGAVFLAFQYDAGFFEQEVLPVFLDAPVSHSPVARLLQLENALREVPHGVAVFYDQQGLIQADYPAPRLDVQRLPVRVPTGIFHAKNVLLLTEDLDLDEDGARTRRMLVATLSANLTRSGWWENVEACHIEELVVGRETRLKEPLLTLLDRVARLTASEATRQVLAPYRAFLNKLEQGRVKSKGGKLLPHLFVCGGGDGQDLADFLKAHVPRDPDRYCVEIVSPFFDKHPGPKSPLSAVQSAIQPGELRLFLPQDASGVARCSPEMYQYARGLGEHVSWGTFPNEMLSLGRSSDAGKRSVHAKVYRIFKRHPKTEYSFLGSANLTSSAHSGTGGNLETGILVQTETPVRPDFWLDALVKKQSAFQEAVPEDQVDADTFLPVQVSFSWKSMDASARWEAPGQPPPLALLASSGPLVEGLVLPKRAWQLLPPDVSGRLRAELTSTSIISARTESGKECKVLVQEDDMGLKPELLRVLPVRDILQYWSLLTPEQRQTFIERRTTDLSPGEAGALMTAIDDGSTDGNDMFERCAGVFHAFAQLETRVLDALTEGRPRQAAALMFGERFDSLPTVLERVLAGEDGRECTEKLTVVDRYLMLMCAVQLCDRVQEEAPDFWQAYEQQASAIREKLEHRSSLRTRLCDADPEQLPSFMNWFDTWFLRRAAVGAAQ